MFRGTFEPFKLCQECLTPYDYITWIPYSQHRRTKLGIIFYSWRVAEGEVAESWRAAHGLLAWSGQRHRPERGTPAGRAPVGEQGQGQRSALPGGFRRPDSAFSRRSYFSNLWIAFSPVHRTARRLQSGLQRRQSERGRFKTRRQRKGQFLGRRVAQRVSCAVQLGDTCLVRYIAM